MNKWIQDVEELERDMDSMLDDGPANSSTAPGWNISSQYRQSRHAVKRLKRVKELISSCNVQVMLADRKSPSKAVQRMAAESLSRSSPGDSEEAHGINKRRSYQQDHGLGNGRHWEDDAAGKPA